nr:hypothetical protein [Tanacetum cinerariifolium]
MLVEMADMTKRDPIGIVKNVLVKIDKFLFPSDFVVIDMLNTRNETTILGRPFLTTIHAEIDVCNKEISLGIRDDKVTFDMDRKIHNFTTPEGKIYMINSTHNDETSFSSNTPTDKSLRGIEIYGMDEEGVLKFWYLDVPKSNQWIISCFLILWRLIGSKGDELVGIGYSELGSYVDWLSWFKQLHINSKSKKVLEGIFYASKGSKSSCGNFGISKSWITCVNTNRNTALNEAHGVSLRITSSVRGLRVADSHTGNHPEDDFTPLETIQRSNSTIRKKIPFELEGEAFELGRR